MLGTAERRTADRPRRRVLIVDDDPRIRLFLSRVLEGAGYEVVQAEDGMDALNRVRRHPPDVIVLDLQMRVMDGIVFSLIQSGGPEPRPPVIVLSAAADAALQAKQMRADRLLAKPVGPRELLDCVAGVLPAAPPGTVTGIDLR